ncbi:hypothetical protein BOX15_Mlig003967g4 [Macrostomum lignano]|uniref:L27 domain-containing protein n=1 Tax=Macrostomum lignano TaxID=282301 RepID=A0A267FNU3_9PLAT|nr:hypothetical protein BOX15_Mlig003967g4 [Macrostomum lignano]
MPVRKEDATRALELLEQYHRRLNTTEDAQLRASIERVIKIFKSKLFNALLDIQEFYEVTLIDENKTAEQRALESVKEPDRWAETAPPSHQPGAAKQKSQKQHRDSPERAAAAAASASDGAFEIVLQRASQGGFGFSIAGGVDEPHLPGDSRSLSPRLCLAASPNSTVGCASMTSFSPSTALTSPPCRTRPQ